MGKRKGSGGDEFNISGPQHLRDVDWKSPDHRRIVAACLVQGVYVLKRDQQEKAEGREGLAQPWFRSFNFQLHRKLLDPKDNSIYGAIYKFESPSDSLRPKEAPEYVIAFRGTMLEKKSWYQDIRLNSAILFQYFPRTKRSKNAMEEVEKIVEKVVKDNPNDDRKVWLAGHSLGSALAVQAGKNAAKKDVLLRTFLFNPPFPRVKQWVSNAKGKVTAKLINLFVDPSRLSERGRDLETTARWSPNLFVNKHDLICSGYIKYFEQRRQMTPNQQLAAMYSLRALFKNWFKEKICRNGRGHFEPLHLLPSASLSTNNYKTGCHEIAQWWSPYIQLKPPYQCTFCPLLDVLEEMAGRED